MIEWLERARRAARVAPARPRVALFLGASDEPSTRIGSIEPAVADALRAAGLALRPIGSGYGIEGPLDPSLAAIAQGLHEQGIVAHWRSEFLAVRDAGGRHVGAVERSAVRALGIATEAVHLIGLAEVGGGIWVQQRAFDKATDPGCWDTLMGGQVAAGESIAATLERETAEEAGLVVAGLLKLERVPSIEIKRPVADGYMIERIEVFRAVVPAGVEPSNRDGEVERFECLDEDALGARLSADQFTLEATLILGAELERRDEAGERKA